LGDKKHKRYRERLENRGKGEREGKYVIGGWVV